MHKKYKNAKDLPHKNRSKTSMQTPQKYKLRDEEIEVLLANFDKGNKQVEKIFVNNKLKYAKNAENKSERMPSPKDFKIKMHNHELERDRERSYRIKERDREKDQRREKEHRGREREKTKQWEKVKNDRGDKEHEKPKYKEIKESPKHFEKISKPKSNHKLPRNESFSEYSFDMNFFRKQKMPPEDLLHLKKVDHKHRSHKHEVEIPPEVYETKKRSKEEKLLKRLRKLKEMRETGFHFDEQNLVFMQHHQQFHKNQTKPLDHHPNAKSKSKILEESKSSVNLTPYEKYVLLENPELANMTEKRRARRKKQREKKSEVTEDHHPVKEKKKVKPNLSELIAPREESMEKIPIKEPIKSQNKAFVDEEFKKYLSTIHKIIDKRLEQMILKNQIIQPTNNESPMTKDPCKGKKSESDLESTRPKSFKEEFYLALAEGDQPSSSRHPSKPCKRPEFKSDFIVNKVEAAPIQSVFADYKSIKILPEFNEEKPSKCKMKKPSVDAIGEPHQVHICQRPERRENSFVIEGIEPAKLSNQNHNKVPRKMFLESKTLNIIEIAPVPTNNIDDPAKGNEEHVCECEELIERKKRTRVFKKYYEYVSDSTYQIRNKSKTDLETTFSDCNKQYMGSTDTLDTFLGGSNKSQMETDVEPTKDTNFVKLRSDSSNDSLKIESGAYQNNPNYFKCPKRKITPLNNIIEEPSNISVAGEKIKSPPKFDQTIGAYFEIQNDNYYKKRLTCERPKLNRNDNRLINVSKVNRNNNEFDQNPMIYIKECGDSRKLIRIASDSSLHILKRPAFSLSVSTCNETPIVSKEQISYESIEQEPMYKSECTEVNLSDFKKDEKEYCNQRLATSKSDVQLKKTKIPKSTQLSKKNVATEVGLISEKSIAKIDEAKTVQTKPVAKQPAVKRIARPNSGVQTQRTKIIKGKEETEEGVQQIMERPISSSPRNPIPKVIENSIVNENVVKPKSPHFAPSIPAPKEKKLTYSQQHQQRNISPPTQPKQKTMLIKSKSNIHEAYSKKSEEKCTEPELIYIEPKDPKLSKSKSEMNVRLKSAGDDISDTAKKGLLSNNEKWDKALLPDLNHTSTFLLTKDYKKSEMSSYDRRRAYDDEIRKKMRRRKFRRFEPQQYNIEVRYCTIEKNDNNFESKSVDSKSLTKKRQPLAVHYRKISDRQRDEAIACKIIESPNSKKVAEKKSFLAKNSKEFKQTFPMLFANSTTSISDFTDISLDQTKFMEEILENSKVLKERYDSIFNFEPKRLEFDAVPFSNEEIDMNLMNYVCKAIERIDDFMEVPAPLKKRAYALSTASSTVSSMEDIAMNLYNYNCKQKIPSIRWTDMENTTDLDGTSDNNEVADMNDIIANSKCLDLFTSPLNLKEKFSCPELNSLSTSFEFLYEIQSNEESDIVMPLHETGVKIDEVLRLVTDPVDTKSRNSSVESGYASARSRKCKSLHNFFKRPNIAALFRTNSTVDKVKKDESDTEDQVLFFRYSPPSNGNPSHSKLDMYERMTKECQSYAQKIREHGQRRSEGMDQEEYKEIPLDVLLGKETRTVLKSNDGDLNAGLSSVSNENEDNSTLRIIASSTTALSFQEEERQRQQELSQKLKERAYQRPFTPCSTIGTATEDMICSSVDVEDLLVEENINVPILDINKKVSIEEEINKPKIHFAKSSTDTRLVRSEPFTVGDYKKILTKDTKVVPNLKPIADEANLINVTKIPSEEECVLINDNGVGFSLFKHHSLERRDRISPHAADKNFFESLLSVYEKEIELTMRLSQDEEFYKNVLLASISAKLNGKAEKKRFKNFFKRKHKSSIVEDVQDLESLSDVVNSCKEDCDLESKRSYVNYHQLQVLACNAKRHFSLLAQAVMTNRGLTDEIKVCGFLKLLDRIEKGDFTVLRREEEVNFEDEIKDQIKQSFCKVYRICLTAAKKSKRKVTQNELNLLRLLVSKYRLGVLSQTDVLAGYIGRGSISTENQLKAAITFLIRSNDKNMNLVDFEEFCNLNINDKNKIK